MYSLATLLQIALPAVQGVLSRPVAFNRRDNATDTTHATNETLSHTTQRTNATETLKTSGSKTEGKNVKIATKKAVNTSSESKKGSLAAAAQAKTQTSTSAKKEKSEPATTSVAAAGKAKVSTSGKKVLKSTSTTVAAAGKGKTGKATSSNASSKSKSSKSTSSAAAGNGLVNLGAKQTTASSLSPTTTSTAPTTKANSSTSQCTNMGAPVPGITGAVCLARGQSVGIGQCMDNGVYHLEMERDGNLVAYKGVDTPVWSTGTNGATGPVYHFDYQTNGDFVVYSGSTAVLDGAYWANTVTGQTATSLCLMSNGDFNLYSGTTLITTVVNAAALGQ
ncbi:hypothetical protein BC830DRAFT_1175603 [Chytriomyces sp. MP71]|nr:hypothetical protein BC830DRAFT_1175603 [Chytriomyces sp. MP71]